MVKSNEFRGASLTEAVRNATAAYERIFFGMQRQVQRSSVGFG